MLTAEPEVASPAIKTFHFTSDRLIAAPIEIVFETVLEPAGPLAEMSLRLEAWPGGRWFRDLGNNTGHLWGHVQVIKPPKLLEICGPMMMSYPSASHVQYRLVEESGGTLLTLTHRAMGLILPQHIEGFPKGWGETLDKLKDKAEKRSAR